jgi:preprotein translocase subunit SecB
MSKADDSGQMDKKPTKAEVQKVADTASLVTVEVKQCEFAIDKTLLQKQGGRLNIDVNVNTNLHSVEPGAFLVEVTTDIADKGTDDPANPPLRAKIIWTVVYLLSEPAPRNAVFAFMLGSTMVHVWPFARELVQSMTTRMGLPPLVLPLLVLGKPVPKDSESD